LRQGLIDIAAVQAANEVSDGLPGGLDTIFSGRMRTAAIRVPKGVRASELAVSVSRVESPSEVRDYTMLTPVATLELDDETVHFYAPEGKAPEHDGGHFAVWARPLTPAAKIRGVRASVAPAHKWMDAWNQPAPEPAPHASAALHSVAAPAYGRVTLFATYE
jgi:hypothetical protein